MRHVAVFLIFFAAPHATAQNKSTNSVANELAVQTALREGRQLLASGQTKQALDVLEAKLALINGNTDYLLVLREAWELPEEVWQALSLLEATP